MFQTADDLVVYIGWVFHNSVLILKQIFLPVRFIFTFLKTAISTALASPTPTTLPFSFDDGMLNMFHNIPYFSNLMIGIGLALGILVLVGLLKLIQKV